MSRVQEKTLQGTAGHLAAAPEKGLLSHVCSSLPGLGGASVITEGGGQDLVPISQTGKEAQRGEQICPRACGSGFSARSWPSLNQIASHMSNTFQMSMPGLVLRSQSFLSLIDYSRQNTSPLESLRFLGPLRVTSTTCNPNAFELGKVNVICIHSLKFCEGRNHILL